MALDRADEAIIAALRLDGRMPNARLAEVVGISPSACLRRLRLLERSGVIRGYTALIDRGGDGEPFVCFAEILLERQTEEFFARCEAAIKKCPDVRECYLMTGDYDYLVRVEADSPSDYERIHRDQLAKLPGVVRIRSGFAIRAVTRASLTLA